MTSQRIRPSRLWYAVAGIVMAAGVACIVLFVLGVVTTFRQVDQLQRVSVPGQAQVTFAQAGRYYLYLEGPAAAAVDSEDSDPGRFTGSASVVLTPAGGGPSIPIEPVDSGDYYDTGSRAGVLAGTFQIDRPGTYLLSADSATPGITHVAVGGNPTRGLLRSFALLFGGIGLGGIGLLIGVTVLVLRIYAHRAQRRMAPRIGPGA